MKVKKAIIPAAGLGTRFLPATKAQPKEMLPIVDTPTIQYIVEEAVASGIEDIIIVTGRSKRAIEDHFDKSYELEAELLKSGKQELLKQVESISNMVNIHYIRQKEPKGLGHAINCARTFIGNEPFAVLLGDDIVDSEIPCLKQMLEVYEKFQTSILGVQTVAVDDVDKYGIVKGRKIEDGLYLVDDLVEKPQLNMAPSNVAILGRYIITPGIFDCIDSTSCGSGGEIQLTDALKILCGQEAIYAYHFNGRRYDVGNRLGFLEATCEFALKRPDIRNDFLVFLKNLINNCECD